jgi:hypothetical protein
MREMPQSQDQQDNPQALQNAEESEEQQDMNEDGGL